MSQQTKHSGLARLILTAPNYESLIYSREHMRYWTFVKECHPTSERQMVVTIYVGVLKNHDKWLHACAKAVELMNLCVRQYKAVFRSSLRELPNFAPTYNSLSYIRPDDLLTPFVELIQD